MQWKNTSGVRAVGAVALGLSAGAMAFPVDGRYIEDPRCDDFGPLIAVEELGTSPLFPTDERIEAVMTFTQETACFGEIDDPGVPNALVVMTNLTGRFWTDLFYVADGETFLTNVDGFATTDEAPPPMSLLTFAFRIDADGLNRPLVFESVAADGVFSPGETWHFIIQDYVNTLGLPASAMGSLDFAGGSSGDTLSSGSIVQFVVPSPGGAALGAIALGALARRRR